MRPGALTQRAGFALVGALDRRAGPDPWDPAGPGTTLTSIVRLPAEIAGPLAARAGALPGTAGQHRYGAGELHLTVLNLDGPADPVAAAVGVLAAAAPFPVVLRGLGVSRQTVYARAYDPTGGHYRLRRELAAAIGTRPPARLRLLGFVTLVRLTGPWAGGRVPADVPLGAFQVGEVEVVRTDKVLSPAHTTVLRRVALTGR